MDRNLRSYNVAVASIFAALAMIFSYVEAILPFSVGIPGVKLGIANIVIVMALYKLNVKYALLINLIRIFIAGFLFSGVFGILYSLAGGLLSLVVMVLVKKAKVFSVVGVSLAGGVAHNLGQLITAALIVSNIKLFLYFPVLVFSGLFSGIIIGIVAGLALEKIEKI
ncbi:MAG: Gx transporter family protein [Eubacterium sp.]|nr:Gx transporter family protein [Eubacterium sp.]